MPAGALLDVGAAEAGVRAYVGVSGGVLVEPVLGSRSTDLLSGLGPPPLADGTVTAVGAAGRAAARAWTSPRSRRPRPSWSCG